MLRASQVAANNAILNRFPLRGNESQNDCTDVDVSLKRFFSSQKHPCSFLWHVLLSAKVFLQNQRQQAHEEIIFRSKTKNDDDVCICETMHRSLVRLLHFICAVCPRSTIFSHLSPTRITTAEDESPLSSFIPTLLFKAGIVGRKVCKHNRESEQPLQLHGQGRKLKVMKLMLT